MFGTDDVALLAEMLAGLLVLRLHIGLQENWSKTKLQHIGENFFGHQGLLVPLPRRTITVSLPPHLDHLLIGGGP